MTATDQVRRRSADPWTALVALLLRRRRLAVAAGLALPLEPWRSARSRRSGPGPAQVMDAELHDDAPADGPSYPSGHAAIATCAAVVVAPYLPGADAPQHRHLASIRRKLEVDPANPTLFITEPGMGYRFAPGGPTTPGTRPVSMPATRALGSFRPGLPCGADPIS